VSLASKDCTLDITGASTSITEEACDAIGSGTPSLYWQVTDHTKDIWDPSVTWTVEVNDGNGWTNASTSNYSLRYLVGVVAFDSDPFGGSTSGNDVRVTGSYLPKYTVLEAHEETISIEPELYDVSRFGDEGMRRLEGVKEISGDFTTHRQIERELDSDGGTEPTLREILLGEETHGSSASIDPYRVLSVQPDGTETQMWRAWVQLASEEQSAAHGEAQSRSYSFEVDDQPASMSSQISKPVDILQPDTL